MKKLRFTLLLALLLGLTLPLTARTVYTLNDGWLFRLGEERTSADGWVSVSIPHTWNTEDCDDDELGFHRGKGWYRRTLRLAPEWADKQVTLHFEGANTRTELYVNGHYIGEHRGGTTAFAFEVSDRLTAGENLIELCVDNSHNPDIPPLSADYTFFGGLYRDVKVIVTEQQHLSTTHYASSGVYLTTPEVSRDGATVTLRTMLSNEADRGARLLLTHRIYDAEGSCVADCSKRIKLAADCTNQEATLRTTIVSPKLWSPDSPYLYRVVTTLTDEKGTELDRISTPLGVRTFRFDPDLGFSLNGEPLKLIGTNRHQDYLGLGYALSDERHLRDIEQIKRMGGNFLRISHYPQDPAVTAACDRMGLLAAIEIPVVNAVTPGETFADCCEQMMAEMIYQSFNSPSVCIWAYMNEVMLRPPYQNEVEKAAYLQVVYEVALRCEQTADRIDPSRATMLPCHSGLKNYDEAGILALPDIIGINLYNGWYSGTFAGFDRTLDRMHAKYPKQSIFVTEYGGDCDIRIRSFQPERFDFSIDYAMLLHEHYLRVIRERQFVSGSTAWNLNDFYSEARGDAMPHINCKGLCTLDRVPKDTYHFYRAALLDEPVVYVCTSGRKFRSGVETAPHVAVEPTKIYTNAKQVTVWHNGEKLGSYPVENYVARVDVPFCNGVNRIEAVVDDRQGGELRTVATTEYRLIPRRFDEGTPFSEMNILLGSTRSFDDPTNEVAWIPDQPYTLGGWGYIGGEPWRPKTKRGSQPASNLAIEQTRLDPMYQTQRRGIEAFRADLTDGCYEVTLHFAELTTDNRQADLAYLLGADAQSEQSVARRFSISINGRCVAPSLDVAAEVGRCRPMTLRYRVDLTEGEGLRIDFSPIVEQTMLSAIRILKIY